MAEELKPCPFCGGAAELKYTDGSWGYYPGKYGVRCKKCFVATTAFSDNDNEKDGKEARESAVKAWNHRVTSPG